MKSIFILLSIFLITSPSLQAKEGRFFDKGDPKTTLTPNKANLPSVRTNHRLLVLADMGNEPDEEQQIMHMLLYANEFDIEGLIAVTGKFLNPNSSNPKKQKLYPELFFHIIEGYSKAHHNLQKHADNWPSPEYLNSVVKIGQKGYGINDVGEGKSSEGSELIIESLKKDDPRPLYVVINAGSNTLAQALFDLKKTCSAKKLKHYISKLRVFENGAQDNAGAYICHQYPQIFWIRSNYQTYCYGGPGVDGGYNNTGSKKNFGPHTWQPYAYSGLGQHQWLLENIIGNHGPFGTYYPIRQFPKGGISFMEGGGTIPWLGLINKGMFSIDHPHWGSWSGRYTREKVVNVFSKHESVNKDEKTFTPFSTYRDTSDTWIDPQTKTPVNNIYTPVWRWRKAFMNDFKCRMDWCKQPFQKANHNPQIVINKNVENSILFKDCQPGERLSFDASESTDPDGDKLFFHWWIYSEAGTYKDVLSINNPKNKQIAIEIPEDAEKKQIHLILEVHDNNSIGALFNYRRIVINVN